MSRRHNPQTPEVIEAVGSLLAKKEVDVNLSISFEHLRSFDKGWSIIFCQGGVYYFGTCRQFFLNSNAFKTIFSLHFVMKTIFYDHF